MSNFFVNGIPLSKILGQTPDGQGTTYQIPATPYYNFSANKADGLYAQPNPTGYFINGSDINTQFSAAFYFSDTSLPTSFITPPAGATSFIAFLIGGGGSGGSGASANGGGTCVAGAGGGGGGCAYINVPVIGSSTTINWILGVGGTGAPGSQSTTDPENRGRPGQPGNPGTDSVLNFGNTQYIANGGGAGQGGGLNADTIGGAGGSYLTTQGTYGQNGENGIGNGGNTSGGNNGYYVNISYPQIPLASLGLGTNYGQGSGGSGTAGETVSTSPTADGNPGCIVFYWLY